MKRLTGVTLVLAGIGAVGGIFGMSQATPAVAGQEGFGFYSITVITIVVAGIAVAILRQRAHGRRVPGAASAVGPQLMGFRSALTKEGER